MSHCAQSQEPKQAGCLVDDSSGDHAFSSHRGGFNIMLERSPPGSRHGDLHLLGPSRTKLERSGDRDSVLL